MGKDKVSTQTQTQDQSGTSTTGIDQSSQDFINNVLRPAGQRGADNVQNQENPFFNGPTGQFLQGLGGLEGLLGQLQGGGFNKDLQDFQGGSGGTGFEVGKIGDGGAMSIFQNASQRGNPFNFNAGTFDPNRAKSFFSPFQDEVVGGIQANADRQREGAITRGAQEATAAGAFGGSRSGFLQAQNLRDVNQDEASLIANTRNQGFQNAMQQALGAFGTEQATGLGAAQGRAQGRNSLLNAGLQAAGLGQRGAQIENQLGLQNAMANQQGRQFDQGQMLQRALGLQSGNLQGLQQQGAASQGLMQGGEQLRGIQNQQAQEQLFRDQQSMNFLNSGFGQTLGSTTNTTGRSTGTVEDRQKGDLFGDLMGAGLAIGGTMLGGPAGGMMASQLFGGGGTSGPSAGASSLFGGAGNGGGSLFGNLGLGGAF